MAAAAVDMLRRLAAATGVAVYACRVMPDHIRLILGALPTRDIVSFVGQAQNLAPRAAWRRGITGKFWQSSCWDHFLRGDEQPEQVVEYVLNNSVRSGLVERRCDDRFSAGGGQAPALQIGPRRLTEMLPMNDMRGFFL